jgi:peptidoglycan L-alanyl-D-glutamate endopeptidase CwlK
MGFNLSARSFNTLKGVDDRLVAIVNRAIEITETDFGVIEGLRSAARQLEMFNKGASQVKTGGKHTLGEAVDLMAYVDGRGSWELAYYDDIANAVAQAARELDVSIRWGAAWHLDDIRAFEGTMEEAMMEYIDLRRSQGKRPFIDAPHFELT